MTIYTLTIPVIDPHALLNANHRMHWRRKAERTRFWRELAMYTTRAALQAGTVVPMERARIVAQFRFPTGHRRDVGNLAPTVKAIMDGLVDAGLLPDDDDKHLTGPDLRRVPEKGPTEIRLEIEELEAQR
ncbi:hypothetical protein KIH74_25470 [Kineosporia sp. J2-2]|uniref:Uncharacterized protein n=1 Tax=Kineosporia corallincola TaxID=2835133 RepID=A0ABS5TMJ5_9ACTN|nr:hypothetical protein [Kineosporia corallincola]MBT0772320.1 hypothetical protein [Kineosporia corallincola]